MSKALKYSTFIIACMLVILAFVTANSYTQLGAAVLLYPLAVYFAFQVFFHNGSKQPVSITVKLPTKQPEITETEIVKPNGEQVEVVDVDKRTFLKFIGAAGISFFIFSLLGRRVDSLLFNKGIDPTLLSGLNGNTGGETKMTESLPTDNYLISEIDDSFVAYYGFIDKEGKWYIMKQDPGDGSFRYAKGDSNLSTNWADREQLKYDYYYNVFL